MTGAGGFVGSHVAAAAARQGWQLTALYRTNAPAEQPNLTAVKVDLADVAAVQSVVLEVFPDVVINAAAVPQGAFVDADPELSEKLNIALPAELARLIHHLGGRLIHLSTEQVFDGQDAPYQPTDTPMPLHLYGQQKVMAERQVLSNAKGSSVVLRLPLMTGNSPRGNRSPHEMLLRDLSEGKRNTQWTDVIRAPASAENVAELISELILRPRLNGIFHWAGPEALSRAELSRRIWAHFSDESPPWDEGPCSVDRVARDLRLASPNLRGRVKLKPEPLAEQIARLQIPADLVGNPVLADLGVKSPGLPRLRKGIDF